jgi:general secretion pathway protein L
MTARALPVLMNALALAETGFRWWLDELAGLVPPRLKHALRRSARLVVVDVPGDTVVVGQLGPRYQEIARGLVVGSDAIRLSPTRPWPPATRGGVAVRLPADAALHRVVVLPLSAERRLRAILSHELERRTPFLADQVQFDYRIVERHADAQRLKVELVVVPRPVVAQALALARQCDLAPTQVGLAAGTGERPAFNFLSDAGETKAAPKRQTYAATGVAAVLLLAAIALWSGREEAATAQLDVQVAAAKETARAADTLRKEIESLTARSNFLATRQQAPHLVEVLEDLTKLLPEDIWVTELHLEGHEGYIVGYSPSATKLIGLFANAPRFANAHFRSPVTQDGKPGIERFDLGFDLNGVPR